MNDLEARVLNAVPAAAFEMNALLSLLRIEESDRVPTAAVSCERRPVLRINPKFVERHCRTDEHLFLLVMHELHHVLLGHTRLFPRATRAHNIAFDALINAMLSARFPSDAHRSFFLDFYGAEEGPLRLLAPPEGARLRSRVLSRLHHLLYVDGQVTAEEVFNTIVRELGAGGEITAGTVLLGSHAGPDEDSWGTDGFVDPEFVRAIRAIVEKWPPPEVPVRGRSLADALERADIRPSRPSAQVASTLRRALLGATAVRIPGAATVARVIRVQDALPQADDRRAAVARSAGTMPLLYAREANARRGHRSGRTRVYVDVSGSMNAYIRPIYGALVALRAYIDPDVRLFSTRVTQVQLAQLARGHLATTGGTEIACVLEDVLRNRVRKVLVITDGYVGEPPAALAHDIRRAGCELRVVLTPDGWRSDLEALAARMDVLPRLSDESMAGRTRTS